MNTTNELCLSGNVGNLEVKPMFGGMMANIGNFMKKNAVLIGVGVVGIGALIYLMTRKKKAPTGISGIRNQKSKFKNRKSRNPKRLTAKRLS